MIFATPSHPIRKLPDFDIGESGSAGFINCDEHILIYRFMREMQADSKGRKAACRMMTFFLRALARLRHHPLRLFRNAKIFRGF